MMMEVATWDGLNTCFHDQNDDDDVNHDEKTGQYHDDKGSLFVSNVTKLWTSAEAPLAPTLHLQTQSDVLSLKWLF